VVLHDAEVQDGAALGELSLVMKGERLPPGTRWQGTPARRC
jgi:carbonic anhydrase/acetyltransferase-like protein (isoleucine patch superfamily)